MEDLEIIRSGPELYDVRNYQQRPTELPKRAKDINRTATKKTVERFAEQLLDEAAVAGK